MILWFRNDLRLDDNPALAAAIEAGEPVIPVYIWAPDEEGDWPPGAASRWWLHHALASLDSALRERGSRLTILRGPSIGTLLRLLADTGARGVYWNRRYEPAIIARDSAIKRTLVDAGHAARSFNAALLNEPHSITKGDGGAYQVYTPYAKAARKLEVGRPVEPSFAHWKHPEHFPQGVPVASLELLPCIRWDDGLARAWDPTQQGLQQRLLHLRRTVDDYATGRDDFAVDGTSRLSPYLHFGQVGPRQVLAALEGTPEGEGRERFVGELYWREFAHHILFHFPKLPTLPLRPEFNDFPWRAAPGQMEAWQQGRTGYPLVDAGMRQLWETGWMHNRVRMVVGSFLVKHLLLPWTEGARWFWDTLADADLANNTLGWQWVGGCGPDAAPYFRVFNPILQSQKFDSEGRYIRRFVPELARLPGRYIHAPWDAPADELRRAQIKLGKDYPRPLVDHKEARARALAAFEKIKDRS